jgi:DNA-binding NarL/FixJ family response regulator
METLTDKLRVVVVDDHPMFRDRLAQIINHETDLTVCGEAGNAQQALETIQQTTPDLAIIDITLDGASGLELIKSIRAQGLKTALLVLSMHDESLYAERALRAGANGYITKRQPGTEVIAAIRRVLSGEVYLSAKMTAGFLRSLAAGAPGGVKEVAPPISRLTDRELEVMELIGLGRTTREIAAALELGVATVDTYRARIKDKMSFRNAVELQHYAIRWVREREG